MLTVYGLLKTFFLKKQACINLSLLELSESMVISSGKLSDLLLIIVVWLEMYRFVEGRA